MSAFDPKRTWPDMVKCCAQRGQTAVRRREFNKFFFKSKGRTI